MNHQSHFPPSFCIFLFKCVQQEKMRLCKMSITGEAKGMWTLLEALILQIQILVDSYTPKYPAMKKP